MPPDPTNPSNPNPGNLPAGGAGGGGAAPANSPANPTNPPANPVPAGGQDPSPGQTTFDLVYVQGLRQEAAQHRTKAKELETQLAMMKTQQDGFMSSVKKALGLELNDPADLEKKLNEERNKSQANLELAKRTLVYSRFTVLAAEKNIVDPDGAFKLADLSGVTADIEKQSVVGIENALTVLVAAKPYLIKPAAPADPKPPGPGGGPTNPPPPPGGSFSKESIAKMTPGQINANWVEIQKALAEGRIR